MRKATGTLAVIAVLALTACSAATGATAHQVRYEVTGTATTADLTLEGEDGTVQQNDQPVPWSYARDATDGEFLYVSAQNKGDGDITCSITVDGQQVRSSTSTGEYAICQADGKL
jgi:hypothetical protein